MLDYNVMQMRKVNSKKGYLVYTVTAFAKFTLRMCFTKLVPTPFHID